MTTTEYLEVMGIKGVKVDLRNRANAKDRPHYEKECRKPRIELENRCLGMGGHNFIFQIMDDRYGCCDRCGCEVLT